jgi:hypothetical protein
MYFKLIKNLHPQFALLSYFARYVVRAAHRTRRKCTTRKVFALVVVAENMSTVADISRAVQWPSTVGTHGRRLLAATSHCEKKRNDKARTVSSFFWSFREHSHFCVGVVACPPSSCRSLVSSFLLSRTPRHRRHQRRRSRRLLHRTRPTSPSPSLSLSPCASLAWFWPVCSIVAVAAADVIPTPPPPVAVAAAARPATAPSRSARGSSEDTNAQFEEEHCEEETDYCSLYCSLSLSP